MPWTLRLSPLHTESTVPDLIRNRLRVHEALHTLPGPPAVAAVLVLTCMPAAPVAGQDSGALPELCRAEAAAALSPLRPFRAAMERGGSRCLSIEVEAGEQVRAIFEIEALPPLTGAALELFAPGDTAAGRSRRANETTMTDSGRRARLLAASLPLTLLAAACAPPGVGEAVPLTDAVTPTGGTCLGCDRPSDAAPSPHRVHYDADLLLDVDAGTLRATWRMDYTFDETPPEHFAFLLNRGLRIDRLEGTGIRGHRIEQFHVPHWNLVVLQLEGGPAPGESITLHVSYSGRLDLPHPINRISADWVELNIESMWHPIFATTDREMWGELRVVLPPGWEVIGASKPSQRDGRHVLRNLSPQTDVAFVAARDFESRASPRFTLHHVGADSTRVAAVLESAEACAAYLDPLYGARTPLPHGQLVLADRGGVSYARGTFLVFSEIEDPEDRLWLEPAICHELAHHWTAYGNFLGPDHWMTEAFPEYISARYARTRFGRKAFEAMVARWREGAQGAGPVWTQEASTRPAGGAMYRLAPYLLYRLEERIGKDRFDRLAEAYMVEDIRSTSKLLEQLRKIAGPEAERTFREELASHGPDVLPDDPEARTVSFTANESTFLAFDISPDGRWIVFTLLGQLWRIPAEGGEAVQMTDAVRDTAVDASPSISADGRSSIRRRRRSTQSP